MLTRSCPILSNFLLQFCGTLKLLLPLLKMIASMTFCSMRNVPFSFVQWSVLNFVPITATISWIFLGSLWYCKLCIELKYPRSSTIKSWLSSEIYCLIEPLFINMDDIHHIMKSGSIILYVGPAELYFQRRLHGISESSDFTSLEISV